MYTRRARAKWAARIPIGNWKELLVVLAAGALSVLLFLDFTRSMIFGAVRSALGSEGVLALAVLLLVIFACASVAALLYGFGQEDPLRRRRHHRRSLR